MDPCAAPPFADTLIRSAVLQSKSREVERERRRILIRNGDQRLRQLSRIAGLFSILALPKLQLLGSTNVVVCDGRLGDATHGDRAYVSYREARQNDRGDSEQRAGTDRHLSPKSCAWANVSEVPDLVVMIDTA